MPDISVIASKSASAVEPDVLPRLRGLLHAYAFWFALAAAIVLVQFTAMLGWIVPGAGA